MQIRNKYAFISITQLFDGIGGFACENMLIAEKI